MYFSQFPTIPYDSKGTGEFKDVKNLLRRVGIRQKVKSNSMLFDTYDIKNGETPESIAFKLYGDAELHWVVMLINNITDRFHDWPMSEAQFLNFINEKYSNPDAIHHYEIEQESGDTSIKINIGTSNADYSSATAITNYEHEQEQQDVKRKIRLLDPSFIDDFVDEFKLLIKESNI
tara:strand:- start:1532 stop:2059 length:528 start_codon:yes stop_codon:yes gene_type:complete